MKLLDPASSSSPALWRVSRFSQISLSCLSSLPVDERNWRFFSEEEIFSTDLRKDLKGILSEFEVTVEMSVPREEMRFSRPFMKDGLQTELRFLINELSSPDSSLISGLSLGPQSVKVQDSSKNEIEEILQKSSSIISLYGMSERFYGLLVSLSDNSFLGSLGYLKGEFSSGETYGRILWYGVDRNQEKSLRQFCHQRLGHGLMCEDVDLVTVSVSMDDRHSLDFFIAKGFTIDSLLVQRVEGLS